MMLKLQYTHNGLASGLTIFYYVLLCHVPPLFQHSKRLNESNIPLNTRRYNGLSSLL